MRHEDYCTLLRNEADHDILTRKLFDVNMRLFGSSAWYRSIVLQCADYILWCAQTKKEGYPKPKGFSGANAGIPFNIIATAEGRVMINPEITRGNVERVVTSNCGSLLLPTPIRVRRSAYVIVEYYDKKGVRHAESGFLPTVQHEIDHNQGILITDRKEEEEES